MKIPGWKVLLEGPTGVGKTWSVHTLVDMGVEVFYLSVGEASGVESLLGYWRDRDQPVPSNLHYCLLESPQAGFKELQAMAEQINRMSYESLAKTVDPNRQKHNHFIMLLTTLSNFVDQNSESFGPVDSWDGNRVLVIDALTGVNNAAMSLVVGAKPVRALPDWGVAMQQIENLLRLLADGCECSLVLIAHVEREVDQVLGGVKLTVGTLGQKLAGKIPPMFSEVVLARREGTKFFWSTANAQADLKARSLPISDTLAPYFKPIVEQWRRRFST